MTLSAAYRIGSVSQFFRLATSFNIGVKGENTGVHAIRDLANYLEEADICVDLCSRLRATATRYEKKYADKEEDVSFSDKDKEDIVRLMNNLRPQLLRELNNTLIIRVNVKTVLNYKELEKLSKQEQNEFFPQEIWESFDLVEKNDFSSAAACLLSDIPTPAVMVALRGAESSIRKLYMNKTGNDPGTKTWRQITNELKPIAKKIGLGGEFVGFLDYIGDEKRNDVQHPSKIYSSKEAPIQFMQAVNLVTDIYSKM